ncbi:MAG: 50S ribosomal protein L2 [Candidatus Riflebacteria bacterium]|nr:50S ribosomal protein L2 [Candidatus Riflebacteria bacterium]
MSIKSYKPTTPSRRFMTAYSVDDITTDKPHKPLCEWLKTTAGRNHHGHVTLRHRGGGARRIYRIIDFKRDKDGVPGTVATIEYDPNRTCRIALVNYRDGEKRYILAHEGIKVGDVIESGVNADILPGNTLPLKNIPLGSTIHSIEMKPGKGAQIARSAGACAQLVGKEGKYAQINMPSGEMRMILIDCRATLGKIGNSDHMNVTLGKAGRKRWMGIRPFVRGSAMNPCDHPHGGGEARSSRGRTPVSLWGTPAQGYKTRKKKNQSSKYIISRCKK